MEPQDKDIQKILDVIKNHLTISISEEFISWSGNGIQVKLLLDGKEISSDYVIIEPYDD